jgi:hypothetical protein
MHRSSWVMFHPMKLCTAWDSPVQHRHSELFSIHMNEFSLSIQMRSYHTELCIVKLVSFANLWLSCIYWDSHELWSQHISGINSIINCPFSTSDLFELRNQYQEVEHLLETYSIASWSCEIFSWHNADGQTSFLLPASTCNKLKDFQSTNELLQGWNQRQLSASI